jgi:Uma2 family endonuclease
MRVNGDGATSRSRDWGPVTWSDFIELDEGDLRELIDGGLVEVEVPSKQHERIVARLIHHLQAWVIPRQAGEVVGSGYKLRVSEACGAMPDLQLLSNETWAKAADHGLESGRPELVVEVLSPTSRRHDRVVKLHWYTSLGVPEYWIVDPQDRIVERLVLRDGAYVIAQIAQGSDVFAPPSYPGLAIALSELWEK